MSLAITHFAFGAAMTALLVWVLAPGHRHRTTLIVLGGLWALVPDLHYILPPRYAESFQGIKHTVVGDVFWFHATFDRLVQGEGTRVGGAVALGFLLVVVFATEWMGPSDVAEDTEDQSEDSVEI